MKTLDEIIETAPYSGTAWTREALYYLMEYRSDKLQYETDRKYWKTELSQKIQAYDDASKKLIEKFKELGIGMLNNPLSWDELKQMEGMPVWVETKKFGSHWYLIDVADDIKIVGIGRYRENAWFYRKDMEKNDWRAFRKRYVSTTEI